MPEWYTRCFDLVSLELALALAPVVAAIERVQLRTCPTSTSTSTLLELENCSDWSLRVTLITYCWKHLDAPEIRY